MICSSVNRFFMLPPLRQTLIQFRTILGEQVNEVKLFYAVGDGYRLRIKGK